MALTLIFCVRVLLPILIGRDYSEKEVPVIAGGALDPSFEPVNQSKSGLTGPRKHRYDFFDSELLKSGKINQAPFCNSPTNGASLRSSMAWPVWTIGFFVGGSSQRAQSCGVTWPRGRQDSTGLQRLSVAVGG